MRTILLIATLVCAGLPAVAAEWPSPRRGYESTALEGGSATFTFARWGEAILIDNVMLNGQGPFRFLLDTGAEGAGRLDAATVAALSIPQVGESVSEGVFGQDHAMTNHRVETLTIGGLRFGGVEMLSRDYSEISGPGLRPIHGILGYHLFNEYLLTIDYPGRTITVARGELPAADGERVLAIISDDEDPEVEIAVGEQRVKALLDTGAMGEFGVMQEVGKGLKFSGEPVVRRGGDGSEMTLARLDGSVRLGEFEVASPQLVMTPGLNQNVVGVRTLAAFALTFDQKNGRVAVARPAARPRLGLEVSWRGQGPWTFTGVTEGSAAAAAGLLATDTIVSLDGRPFGEIDREDMLRLLDQRALVVGVEREGAPVEVRVRLE